MTGGNWDNLMNEGNKKETLKNGEIWGQVKSVLDSVKSKAIGVRANVWNRNRLCSQNGG